MTLFLVVVLSLLVAEASGWGDIAGALTYKGWHHVFQGCPGTHVDNTPKHHDWCAKPQTVCVLGRGGCRLPGGGVSWGTDGPTA